jgi:hypothetical protein
VQGVVLAHHPWGVELRLTDGTAATVDLLYIGDAVEDANSDRWPAVASEVTGTYQCQTPNGQHRVSLRSFDR